jgi:hypothetical protein
VVVNENIKRDLGKAIKNLNSPNPDCPQIIETTRQAIEFGDEEAPLFICTG